MATIIKRGNKYQAQINRSGVRKTKTFTMKADAQQWARKVESEVERGLYVDTSAAKKKTAVLFDLYHERVLPTLKATGRYSDKYRLQRLRAVFGPISLHQLTSDRIRRYIESRASEGVSPDTIRKEVGLLSRVLNAGERDFGFVLPRGNPVSFVRRPRVEDRRERRLTPDEFRVIANIPVYAFMIETAIRRGEVANLRWSEVDLDKRVLHIRQTKTDIPRSIPLSLKSAQILNNLQGATEHIEDLVWGMSADSLSRRFIRLCKQVLGTQY